MHAYVLMTNHIHLLMTATRDNGVAAVMKRLGQRYVQHVNRTYRRTGGLFEGRFRSSLIEADAQCRQLKPSACTLGGIPA